MDKEVNEAKVHELLAWIGFHLGSNDKTLISNSELMIASRVIKAFLEDKHGST